MKRLILALTVVMALLMGSGIRLAAAGAIDTWLLFADDGSPASNNLNIFRATTLPHSDSIQTPIPQDVSPLAFNTLPLGEIQVAHGKAFVVISSGLTGAFPGNGGIKVIDQNTHVVEATVELFSTTTKVDGSISSSRIVHTLLDPEEKHLWAMNDGPSGDASGDSAFRINIDPASPGYLTYVEIKVGNGHHKPAIGRPSWRRPTAMKAMYISDLTERRINVIDDDPRSPTYGTVVKIIRNVAASPHGFDYSPASGRGFAGITGGGIVSVDATKLDSWHDHDHTVDIPDVDCTGITDNYCFKTGDPSTPDPSVYQLKTGPAGNPTLIAGYVHVVEHNIFQDTVYTTGYSGAAAKGWLTAINPGGGSTAPTAMTAIDLGNMSPSSFAEADDRLYVPSSGNGTIKDQVKVVDADKRSSTFNTILSSITVGLAVGENRNGQSSPDGRLVLFPNTTTNTASVIDTDTDTVIDTLTLVSTAKNVRIAFNCKGRRHFGFGHGKDRDDGRNGCTHKIKHKGRD